MIELHAAIAAVLLRFLSVEAPVPERPGFTPSIRPQAEATHKEAAQFAMGDEERFMVRPFLIADRVAREVTVWGQMTGMVPGDPVEFFVVTDTSGQDYESLMISWVKPSDLHAALGFIGLKPLGPVDLDVHRFWPRGDYVDADLEVILAGGEGAQRIPYHQWITRPDGEVMSYMPWVFTGAPMLPHPNDPDELVYAADMFSPNSIAANFNLRNTVFDLPQQGSKTGMYGQFLRNPEMKTADAQPVLLRLRPTPAEVFPRGEEAKLRVESPQSVRLFLETGGLEEEMVDLEGVQPFFASREDRIYYLTADFGDGLTLADAKRLAGVLENLEGEQRHVRVEPPVEGQLYYQAYAPPQRFRERDQRPTQPYELHLSRSEEGTLRGTLLILDEIWSEGPPPRIVEKRHEVENVEDFQKLLEEYPPLVQVLFVFAPLDAKHGEWMSWLRPVLRTFPVIYVYEE